MAVPPAPEGEAKISLAALTNYQGFYGHNALVTDTPPDPVLLLLKLIEDLCAAIAQATGVNLFTRLMLIPVRRKLRGMAQAVAEVAADRAARAQDAPAQDAPAQDALAPNAPAPNAPAPNALGQDRLAPHVPAWDAPAPDATQAVAAAPAPVPPLRLADTPPPPAPRAPLPAAIAAAQIAEDVPATPRAAPDAAAAPVIPDAGGIPDAARPARPQRRTAPTRNPAALGSLPAPVALGVAALHAAVTFALGPPADRNAISRLGFCARYLLR